MENNSITGKITDTIFGPLKIWVEESNGNWNMLIGIGFALLLVGFILSIGYTMKIGKADERTNQINLKSSLIILSVIVFSDIIFPKEYMWQVFFLFKYSLAFIAAGIYLAIRYRTEFS